MSRGLGRLQRSVLSAIEQGSASARQLAERLGSSYEPVRKALRGLHHRGLIVVEGDSVDHGRADAWYRGHWERFYSLPGKEYWRGRDDELARLEANR